MLVGKACRAVLSVLLVSISCQAQPSTLTVDAVLARVREHIAEYETSVPSFISDEFVLSQSFVKDKLKEEMKVESTFEVKRKDAGKDMRETRTVKLVDGRVLKKNERVSLPWKFSGGVANVIGFSGDKCSDFRFAEALGEGRLIAMESSRKPVSSDCPSPSQTYTNKVCIDPGSFQVVRLEVTIQDMKIDIGAMSEVIGHLPFFSFTFPSDQNNVMTLSVDYAPVELGGKTYWLTKTVTDDFSDKPGVKKQVHLHYEAHYSNYHKFASTVTILPGHSIVEQTAPAVGPTPPTAAAVETRATAAVTEPATIAPAEPMAATTASTPAAASEKPYAFEVVSMHQNKTTASESLRHFDPTPNGYHVQNMSLHTILMTAFAPQIGGGPFYTSDQIKGIPDWADSARYDIQARISDADRAEWQNPERQKAMLRAMIQSMLADRCKLVAHREVGVNRVYSLELAKGGPKFRESTPDEVFPAGIKMPWGGVVVPTGDGMRMYGTTMASFATVLAERTDAGRTIQDKTGLTGKYNLTLKAEPPLNPASGEPTSESESDWDAAMLAGINALGLKLVSTKAPVEMLIVDHLDRPSETSCTTNR